MLGPLLTVCPLIAVDVNSWGPLRRESVFGIRWWPPLLAFCRTVSATAFGEHCLQRRSCASYDSETVPAGDFWWVRRRAAGREVSVNASTALSAPQLLCSVEGYNQQRWGRPCGHRKPARGLNQCHNFGSNGRSKEKCPTSGGESCAAEKIEVSEQRGGKVFGFSKLILNWNSLTSVLLKCWFLRLRGFSPKYGHNLQLHHSLYGVLSFCNY